MVPAVSSCSTIPHIHDSRVEREWSSVTIVLILQVRMNCCKFEEGKTGAAVVRTEHDKLKKISQPRHFLNKFPLGGNSNCRVYQIKKNNSYTSNTKFFNNKWRQKRWTVVCPWLCDKKLTSFSSTKERKQHNELFQLNRSQLPMLQSLAKASMFSFEVYTA